VERSSDGFLFLHRPLVYVRFRSPNGTPSRRKSFGEIMCANRGIVLQCNAQCNTVRDLMSEVKNRSVRLDDENYRWLQELPGRSLNEAVERLRAGNGGVVKTDATVAEILELVRSLPDAADIEDVMRNVIQEFRAARNLPDSPGIPVETPSLPKNAFCKHCGHRFAGVKFATICPDCKSSGHTLAPAECPACTAGRAL
jgi:predicted Zn-ribbon and HTH transcriptional regulator